MFNFKTLEIMNLENLNLVELNAQEVQEVNGGWWQGALAALGAVIYIYNEGHDFIKGFNETYK